jgi:hypothetical protein
MSHYHGFPQRLAIEYGGADAAEPLTHLTASLGLIAVRMRTEGVLGSFYAEDRPHFSVLSLTLVDAVRHRARLDATGIRYGNSELARRVYERLPETKDMPYPARVVECKPKGKNGLVAEINPEGVLANERTLAWQALCEIYGVAEADLERPPATNTIRLGYFSSRSSEEFRCQILGGAQRFLDGRFLGFSPVMSGRQLESRT